jgi:cytochrome o ubiquinol oxidase subunit III
MSHDATQNTFFGFWTYLMTDCLLFATLFATYLVLHSGTYGGITSQELFNLPYVLTQTVILLVSSFTSGLAMLPSQLKDKRKVVFWFAITFLLGATFLTLELREFAHFISEGHSFTSSGFLSAFFTLVGTHGAHIAMGLLWMIVLLVPVIRYGLTPVSLKRLYCLRLFWHFLDVVWIFVFTVVYLMGAM